MNNLVVLAQELLSQNQALTEQGALMLAAAMSLYQMMTEAKRYPIENKGSDKNYQDKTRYDRLCELRRNLSHERLPDEWLLDERGCPRYRFKLREEIYRLRAHVNDLEHSSHPQKIAIAGMLETLEELFTQLKSRKAEFNYQIQGGVFPWLKYRSDGYEAMFFCDLAIWLSVKLPRHDIKDPQTLRLIQEWIDYCERVTNEVLFFRGDERDAYSPKNLLTYVIRSLKDLHQDVFKIQKTSTFNDKIHQINNIITHSSKNTLAILYALIENKNINPVHHCAPLNVQNFLMHANSKLKKRTIGGVFLVNTNQCEQEAPLNENFCDSAHSMMGQWLLETLTYADIRSNDFKNHRKIEMSMVRNHLSNALSKIERWDTVGFWEKHTHRIEDMQKDVRYIVAIHQQLLMLYAVKDSIVLSALITAQLGDAWVYGEDTGKEIIEILMHVICDAHEKLNQAIKNFWDFYFNRYQVKNRTKDNRDIVFIQMHKINNLVASIHENHTEIERKMADIRQRFVQDNITPESIEEKLQHLKENLLNYFIYTGTEIPVYLKRSSSLLNLPQIKIIKKESKPFLKNLGAENLQITNSTHENLKENKLEADVVGDEEDKIRLQDAEDVDVVDVMTAETLSNEDIPEILEMRCSVDNFHYYGDFKKTLDHYRNSQVQILSNSWMPSRIVSSVFYSKLQEKLVNHLLWPYYPAVTQPEWISLFLGIYWHEIVPFKCLYAFIHQVIEQLCRCLSDKTHNISDLEIRLIDDLLSDALNEYLDKKYWLPPILAFEQSVLKVAEDQGYFLISGSICFENIFKEFMMGTQLMAVMQNRLAELANKMLEKDVRYGEACQENCALRQENRALRQENQKISEDNQTLCQVAEQRELDLANANQFLESFSQYFLVKESKYKKNEEKYQNIIQNMIQRETQVCDTKKGQVERRSVLSPSCLMGGSNVTFFDRRQASSHAGGGSVSHLASSW